MIGRVYSLHSQSSTVLECRDCYLVADFKSLGFIDSALTLDSGIHHCLPKPVLRAHTVLCGVKSVLTVFCVPSISNF